MIKVPVAEELSLIGKAFLLYKFLSIYVKIKLGKYSSDKY